MLGVERGNVDMLLFALIVLGLVLLRRNAWAGAAPIVLAGILKYYPAFAGVVLVRLRRRWPAAIVSAVILAAYAVATLNDIRTLRHVVPRVVVNSYGAGVVVEALRLAHVSWVQSAAEVRYVRLAVIALGLLLALGFLLVGRAGGTVDERRLDAFWAGSAIYLATYVFESNFDYRLVFLLLCIPQLCAWARRGGAPAPWPAAALGALLVTLWLSSAAAAPAVRAADLVRRARVPAGGGAELAAVRLARRRARGRSAHRRATSGPRVNGSMRRYRGPLLAGAALTVATWAFVSFTPVFSSWLFGDARFYENWGNYITNHQVPYRDFDIEYPPGALPTFAVPVYLKLLFGHYNTWYFWFRIELLAFALLMLGGMTWALAELRASRRHAYVALCIAGATPALLGPIALFHYDYFPAMFAVFAVAALLARRGVLACTFATLGAVAKVYPIVIVPIALDRAVAARALALSRRRRRRNARRRARDGRAVRGDRAARHLVVDPPGGGPASRDGESRREHPRRGA